MNYQETDYTTETDTAPWTAPPAQSPTITTHRSAQLVPMQAPAPLAVNPPVASNVSEMFMLGSMLQSVQQAQTQQTYLLREFDARLSRLENNARPQPAFVAATPSFERATWWALWGLLMLVLGSALAVIIILILLNVQFR